MLRVIEGDIFDTKAQAIVNPVNTLGISGAGLAKQFKEKAPENFKAYEAYCKGIGLEPGECFYSQTGELGGKTIFNIATKKHFKALSHYSYIVRGLLEMFSQMDELELTSVALPLLGAGLGKLDEDEVFGIIQAFHLNGQYNKKIYVYYYTPKNIDVTVYRQPKRGKNK